MPARAAPVEAPPRLHHAAVRAGGRTPCPAVQPANQPHMAHHPNAFPTQAEPTFERSTHLTGVSDPWRGIDSMIASPALYHSSCRRVQGRRRDIQLDASNAAGIVAAAQRRSGGGHTGTHVHGAAVAPDACRERSQGAWRQMGGSRLGGVGVQQQSMMDDQPAPCSGPRLSWCPWRACAAHLCSRRRMRLQTGCWGRQS